MISSNGSNGEDNTTMGHDTGGGSSNVLFHMEGSHEASPEKKVPFCSAFEVLYLLTYDLF